MGRDKALLMMDGQSLAERGARLLAQVAEPVVEVGPGHSPLPAVREDPPGTGPLAALCAGATELRRLGHDGPVLVLAVDMPRVSVGLLRLLAGRPGPDTAVPRDRDGRAQPLCARYGADALTVASGLVAAGERSLRSLLAALADLADRDAVDAVLAVDAVGVLDWVDPPEWEPVAGPDAFCDLDTPGDVERLRSGP